MFDLLFKYFAELLVFFSQLLPSLVGVVTGAVLAFTFGLHLQKRKEKQENKGILHYFIASMTYISSNLYELKEQIVQHRYKECIECKNIIKTNQHPKLQIQYMSKYIFTGNCEWPITQEKLEFLATADPNIIILSGTLRSSISTFNSMITYINEDTERYIKGEKQPDSNDIMMMIDTNERLYEQLDDTLYLTNLLIDVLIKYGSKILKKEMKIKSIELTHDKYKNLKPKPIDSWEKYEWFPKKKGILCKLVSKIKTSKFNKSI